MRAARSSSPFRSASASGLDENAHITKVFTMVGITKYAGLFASEAEALAAL
jgi:hypothetical protein